MTCGPSCRYHLTPHPPPTHQQMRRASDAAMHMFSTARRRSSETLYTLASKTDKAMGRSFAMLMHERRRERQERILRSWSHGDLWEIAQKVAMNDTDTVSLTDDAMGSQRVSDFRRLSSIGAAGEDDSIDFSLGIEGLDNPDTNLTLTRRHSDNMVDYGLVEGDLAADAGQLPVDSDDDDDEADVHMYNRSYQVRMKD